MRLSLLATWRQFDPPSSERKRPHVPIAYIRWELVPIATATVVRPLIFGSPLGLIFFQVAPSSVDLYSSTLGEAFGSGLAFGSLKRRRLVAMITLGLS